MNRIRALALCLVVLALGAPSCVLVSSRNETPPARDAGVDARVTPPPRDAQVDAGDRPTLSREEATRRLLESVATNVVLPTYQALATDAAALEAATAAYATSRSTADREAAQEAWRRVMPHAQRAELLQFGPAGMALPEIQGSQGLRDRIYFYPQNRCLMNVVVERQTYQDLSALAAQPSFVRGLGAVEYRLFEDERATGCDPGASTRVDEAVWSALDDEELLARRAAAAHADARLVRQAADALLAAWSPSGGDFARSFAQAGQSGSAYPSTQAALNAVFWAMYYADRGIKDMKLGTPAGINELCSRDACPELLESRWGGQSSAHLAENLRVLRDLYLGGPPERERRAGFDDLLRAVDQASVAADLAAAIDDALEAAEALPPVDVATFPTHLATYRALHARVQLLTTLLKVDFAGVLGFTPPPGAGEDND